MLRKNLVLIFWFLFLSTDALPQNYIQQYPINGIIDNAGSYNRIIFSVYDSVFSSFQYHYTPYYETNLLLKNNGGAFVGYNSISPGVEDSIFGYITYDHFLHQFSIVNKFHSDQQYPGASMYANNAGIRYSVHFFNPNNDWITTVDKYDLNQHAWKSKSTFQSLDWGMGPIQMWSMTFESTDVKDGYGYRHIFDPALAEFKQASVGCDFSGGSGIDDYYVSASGPCENDGIYAYNSELHTWKYFAASASSYGSMHMGIFNTNITDPPFHNYFAYYDEQ